MGNEDAMDDRVAATIEIDLLEGGEALLADDEVDGEVADGEVGEGVVGVACRGERELVR